VDFLAFQRSFSSNAACMSRLQRGNQSPLSVPREFTTTHWSVILVAGGAVSTEADTALENLCRTYWYPLYT
jgi:hypothetical protein